MSEFECLEKLGEFFCLFFYRKKINDKNNMRFVFFSFRGFVLGIGLKTRVRVFVIEMIFMGWWGESFEMFLW